VPGVPLRRAGYRTVALSRAIGQERLVSTNYTQADMLTESEGLPPARTWLPTRTLALIIPS